MRSVDSTEEEGRLEKGVAGTRIHGMMGMEMGVDDDKIKGGGKHRFSRMAERVAEWAPSHRTPNRPGTTWTGE